MRRVTTIHIAALIAALVYAVQARAFEPVELPAPRPLPAPCAPLDCADNVLDQLAECMAWPVVDADVEAARLCVLRAEIRLACCAGVPRHGVVCPR
jgi:hypothetical protein